MTAKSEQETTVSHIRADDWVFIYTCKPADLRRLRNDVRTTEIAGGYDWARFRVHVSDFDPLKGFRRRGRKMTDEQRQAAGERLAAARQKQEASK